MAEGSEPRPITTMTFKDMVLANNNVNQKTYDITATDFNNFSGGTYLIVCTTWSTDPLSDIYLVSYSGGNTVYCNVMQVTNNIGTSKVTVDKTNGTFTVTGNHIIYSLTY